MPVILFASLVGGKATMRHFCAIVLLCLFGCGGTTPDPAPVASIVPPAVGSPSVSPTPTPQPSPQPPASIGTQPAQAQTFSLTNISTVSEPQNAVTATNGPTSAFLIHLSPGTPATIVLSGAIANSGQSVTLAHTPPAIATNDGTYTVTQVNPPNPVYTITCPNCVQYDDETGYPPPNSNCTHNAVTYPCSQSFDAFPALIADGFGNILNVYVNGYGSQAVFPADINWKKVSSAGIDLTAPATLFHDTSLGCTDDGFATAYNCMFENLMAGKLSNGNVVAFGAATGNGASALGVFSRIWNGASWASQVQLSNPAPDSSNWWVVYGNTFPYNGSQTCSVGFTSVNSNQYLGCTGNNGASWTFSLIGTTPTNECAGASPSTNNIVVLCRMAECLTLASTNCGSFKLYTSTNGGASWTASSTNIGASVACTKWELVSPWIDLPAQLNGQATLYYGQRCILPTASTTQLALTFDPKNVLANSTAFPLPQVLSTGTLNPTDCCYISATNGLIGFYRYYYNNGGWKLYTQTANYQAGSSLSVSGMSLNGAIR